MRVELLGHWYHAELVLKAVTNLTAAISAFFAIAQMTKATDLRACLALETVQILLEKLSVFRRRPH